MARELIGDKGEKPQEPQGPPPLPAEAGWYAAIEGKQAGPFTQDELAAQIKAGKVTKQTLVWRKGMPDWKTASDVSDLASLFAVGPPPSPNPD